MRAYDFIDEMALSAYQPIGNFEKPGPFKATDRKLVPHPKTQMKTQKFFNKSPYDFRLFFSNIPGTGKYAELGEVDEDTLIKIFGVEQAYKIKAGSQYSITVVFVGNSGVDKVMMTPWIMAHRFGHAVQVNSRSSQWHVWREAEEHFFRNVNSMLEEYYGKIYNRIWQTRRTEFKTDMSAEYNALFNAIGTQRSSRSNKIKRPYEFLYEIFAQYLGTGHIKFNPLPTNLGYGRQVWGNPTNFLHIKSEYRNDLEDLAHATDILARDMEHMFNDVLAHCEGRIYVM